MKADGMFGIEMNRVDGGDGASQGIRARGQFHVNDFRRRRGGEVRVTMTPNDGVLRLADERI